MLVDAGRTLPTFHMIRDYCIQECRVVRVTGVTCLVTRRVMEKRKVSKKTPDTVFTLGEGHHDNTWGWTCGDEVCVEEWSDGKGHASQEGV